MICPSSIFDLCVETFVLIGLVVLISLFSYMHYCEKASITCPAEKVGDPPAQLSMKSDSIPLKEKITKAERRALQEAQRAAKAAGKGSNGLY